MMRRLLLISLAVTLLTGPALAVEPGERLDDPALESRARVLSQELRCLVCQNQSIDDSDAPLARDLRVLVRERIAEGDSDEEVLDFIVARYGEFVLLRPRVNTQTYLLWALPFIVLLGGALTVVFTLRRKGERQTQPSPLSPDEEARLEEIVNRRDASGS